MAKICKQSDHIDKIVLRLTIYLNRPYLTAVHLSHYLGNKEFCVNTIWYQNN